MRLFNFLLAFCLFVGACSAQGKSKGNKNKTAAFKMLDASAEKWVSGVQGGGSGIEYYFKVAIRTADKIVFDSLWTDPMTYKLFVTKQNGPISNAPVTFGKGDTIIVRASYASGGTGGNRGVKSVVPVSLNNNDAIIGYKVNNKQQYFPIKRITIKTSTDRP